MIAPALARAQVPQWIWTSTNNQSTTKEVRYFRKTFTAKDGLIKSHLVFSGDDKAEVFINGVRIGTVDDWKKPKNVDVTKRIVPGQNVIAVRCENEESTAGLIVRLQMTMPTTGAAHQEYNPKAHAGLQWNDTLITDSSWVFSNDKPATNWTKVNFDDSSWQHAVSVARLGDKPWGDIFVAPQATPLKSITVEPGFKLELLHSADTTEGSWISMAIDPLGRLIICPQSEGNLLRVTVSAGGVQQIERIDQPVTSAMGLLYVDNCLYVDGDGPQGHGVYRLRAKGDLFEAPEFLRAFNDGGEHGPHDLVLGPEHKLYMVNGNFTHLPTDLLPTSPHHNYADDQLLQRAEDGNGFGAGMQPPGGHVLRMDMDAKNVELWAAGTRNTYAIGFSPESELFGFDSDMEWDWGTAWYRPTRVNLWVPGGDYGFHEGAGKFPPYYEDTLPALVNVGLGSPTGVMFGTRSDFPKPYKDAFWMEDWSYGRLFAVHLTPNGASYHASVETVLRGTPLNLTALQFGNDGALYFTTGGRGIQSGLYRLTYTGGKYVEPKKTSEQLADEAAGKQGRRLRHDLESLYGERDPRIVDAVWSSLGSDDRWIRYAARIALEWQDVQWWKSRALSESDPETGMIALLALARVGGTETQPPLLNALKKFSFTGMDKHLELLKLRVLEVSFARQGTPDSDQATPIAAELDPLYPADDFNVNRELCQLLLYLKAPDAIGKTLALLDKAPTQEEQTYYVLRLRNIIDGWTLDQQKDYLSWFKKDHEKAGHPSDILQFFKDVTRDYSDGSSFPTFIKNFRNEFVQNLTPADQDALTNYLPKAEAPAGPQISHAKFVKTWTVEDLQPDIDQAKSGRSFEKGKAAYTQAQCILCHRFGNSGGSVGPELAAVASRLSPHDVLESIIEPSKVVSELFQNTIIETKDGDVRTGRIVEENDQKIVLMTEPIKGTKVEILKSDIDNRRLSKVSPMPDGLINSMTESEIWDLMAYLETGGKRNNPAFKK